MLGVVSSKTTVRIHYVGYSQVYRSSSLTQDTSLAARFPDMFLCEWNKNKYVRNSIHWPSSQATKVQIVWSCPRCSAVIEGSWCFFCDTQGSQAAIAAFSEGRLMPLLDKVVLLAPAAYASSIKTVLTIGADLFLIDEVHYSTLNASWNPSTAVTCAHRINYRGLV